MSLLEVVGASNPATENWQLFLEVANFSRCIKEECGVLANLIINNEIEDFMKRFEIFLYGNGSSLKNRGYISILFLENKNSHLNSDSLAYDFLCILSIIDIERKSRFPQSYVTNRCAGIEVVNDKIPFTPFGFERFLNCDTMMNSFDELISEDDRLTISLNVSVTEHFKLDSVQAINIFLAMGCDNDIKEVQAPDGSIKYLLPFNTALFNYLQCESPYFKRIAKSPMLEAATECMPIPTDEYPAFNKLGRFVSTGSLRHIENIEEFIQFYKIADKYGLLRVKESCVEHLQKYISDENVTDILILADFHNDQNLKDAAIHYIQSSGFHILHEDWSQLINLNSELANEVSQNITEIETSSFQAKDTKNINENEAYSGEITDTAFLNYFS